MTRKRESTPKTPPVPKLTGVEKTMALQRFRNAAYAKLKAGGKKTSETAIRELAFRMYAE